MTDPEEHFTPVKKPKLEVEGDSTSSDDSEKKIIMGGIIGGGFGETSSQINESVEDEVAAVVKDDAELKNNDVLVNPVIKIVDGKQGDSGEAEVANNQSDNQAKQGSGGGEEVDRMQQIFCSVPPEVWDVLLDYVKDPSDVLTVMNTCSVWYNILKAKRTKLLFPLVLPHLTKVLKPSTILNLRLVSKHWKGCVDNPLQNHGTSPQKFECHWWHSDSPFEGLLKHVEPHYVFPSVASRQFMETIRPTHNTSIPPPPNPFITRTITIKVESGIGFRPSLETGVELLQNFGHHIWEFTHYCPILGGQEDVAVTLLPGVLRNLPNLKLLKIDWNSDGVMRVLPETQSFLLQNKSFPPLPQLTHLNFDFRGGGELELVLGTALLRRYGSQLTNLICRGEFLEKPSLTPNLIRDLLPNLKNLRIFCVTSNCLEKLSQMEGYPLEQLQLWYSFHNMEFKSVIKAVNSFSQTLNQLHMDVKINYPSFRCWDNDDDDNNISTPTQHSTSSSSDPLEEFPFAEVGVEFPKLTKLSSPVSSINSPWFWDLVKSKFRCLKTLELQTAMEASFASYERKYLSKEIERSKDLFQCLSNLNRIRFWFHNNKGRCLVLRRRENLKV